MALREAFPLKRRDAIQELVDASMFSLDSDDDFIDYISLFKEVSSHKFSFQLGFKQKA